MIGAIRVDVRRSQRGGREFEPPAVHHPSLRNPSGSPRLVYRPNTVCSGPSLSVIPAPFPCLDVNREDDRMTRPPNEHST